jgi:lipoprotein signal peptidase
VVFLNWIEGCFLKRAKYIGITVFILLFNYFLDRITKWIAVEYLKGNPTIKLFKEIIIITYVENKGAFLSLGFQGNRFS